MSNVFVVIFYALLLIGGARLLLHDSATWARLVGAGLVFYGIAIIVVAIVEAR